MKYFAIVEMSKAVLEREREEDTSRDLGVCGFLEFVPSNLATFGIATIMPSTLLSER